MQFRPEMRYIPGPDMELQGESETTKAEDAPMKLSTAW
jgi:hypothetical protein